MNSRMVLAAALDLPNRIQGGLRLPPAVEAEFGVTRDTRAVQCLDTSFAADIFWRAVQDAVNGRTAIATDLEGADTFRFEPGTGSARTAIVIVNEATGARQSLADSLWELLTDSEQARRLFLDRHPEFFDMAAHRRDASAAELVATAEPHARMERFAEHRHQSAEWFYLGLARRLRSRDAPEMDWFTPPSAASLVRHLRLPEVGPVDWEAAGASLLADEGLEEAVARLSSLPRLLPTVLRNAFHDALDEQARTLLAAWETRLRTPVARLHLFHLCLERHAADDACRTQADRIKTELLDARINVTVYPGFLAIMQWARELFHQWEEAESLPPTQRITLSWLHAARVHDILLARRADETAIQQNFSVAFLRLHPGLAFDDAAIHDDVSFAPASWQTVLGRGLGAVAANVTPEAAIQARLSVPELLGGAPETPVGAEGWLPWMQETELTPDALGSFLGGPWEAPLRAVLGDEAFSSLFPATPAQLAVGALEALENNPADRHRWVFLRWMLGEGPIQAGLRDRLRALLERVDIADGFAEAAEDRATFATVLTVCESVRRLGEVELRPRFEGQLVVCMQALRQASLRTTTALTESQTTRETLAGLLCAARQLTAGTDAAAPAFYQLAAKMIRAWPEAGTLLRKIDGGAVPSVPLRQVQGAWKYYLALRTSP